MTELVQLTRKDLASRQEVRWCPGCGDYSILKSMQTVLADLGVPREKLVVVSGIGCAARFPYYMETYGMHSIHGRAPAVATGVKMANPDLHVWVVGGDGDMMSIGGNHFIHAVRRNIDLTILVFNNRIYGLTKGQFSPTSGLGVATKSSPMGSIDPAMDPVRLALGAGGTFVARSVDIWGQHLQATLRAAHAHRGCSVIEILQNCIIFNDGTWEDSVGRAAKAEHSVDLRHGERLTFGADGERGLALGPSLHVEVVDVAGNEDRILVHDAQTPQPGLAQLLAGMNFPDLPMPTGIFRSVPAPTYGESMDEQVRVAQEPTGGKPSLDSLLSAGDTWVVS